MGLKSTIKKLVKNLNDIERRYENVNDEKINDVKQIVNNRLINEKKVIFLRNRLAEATGSIENIQKAIKKIDQEKDFDDIVLEGYKNILYKLRSDNVKVPEFEGLSLDQVKENTKEFFENSEYKELLNNSIQAAHRSALSMLIYKDLEKGFDAVSKLISKETLDSIDIEVNEIDPSNYEKRKHISTFDKETQELIKNTKSKKEIDALNYVNDNILVRRDSDGASYDKDYSENYMATQKRIIKNEIVQNLNDNNIYHNVIKANDNGFFQMADGLKNVDKEQIDKEVSENGIKLSDATKATIKKALHKLEKMKMYDTEESMFKIGEFKSEEGTKVYAFKNIAAIHKNIQEAIKEGKTEEVVKLTKAYKKCDKEMTELMDLLKSIDTPFYPGNVSLARNDDIPAKYSEDIIGTSMANGLWQALGTLKSNGIPIDEFVDNPTKAYVDFINNGKYIEEETNKQGFTSENDFLDKMIDGTSKNNVSKSLNKRLTIFRGFEFMASLDKDNYAHNYEAYQVIHNGYMLYHSMNVRNEVEKLFNPTNDKIKNFILSDPKDKNYFAKFNDNSSQDKLKNIDSKEVLDRLKTFKDNPKKEVQQTLKEAATDIVKEKGINCKEYSELCSLAGKMGYKAFKDNMQTNDIALSIKDNYDEMSKNGINKNDFVTACNYLKIVDEQYNKRNWFGKHLRKEGRAEKALMDKIKEDFIAKGISKDDIENFLKGNKTIDNLENILEPSSEKENTVEASEKDKIELINVTELDNKTIVNLNENEKDTDSLVEEETLGL